LLRLHGWRQVVLLVLLLRLARGGRGLLVGAAFRPAPRPPAGVGHCSRKSTVSLLIETPDTPLAKVYHRDTSPTQTRSPAEKGNLCAISVWLMRCEPESPRRGAAMVM
ncbi:unnamed protein product, partial [Ectocarpus sp. 8 AP-2014]